MQKPMQPMRSPRTSGRPRSQVIASLASQAHGGYVAVGVQPLVPERRVCLQLAREYEGRDALQIDVDDL